MTTGDQPLVGIATSIVIGICGREGTGKSTIANILTEQPPGPSTENIKALAKQAFYENHSNESSLIWNLFGLSRLNDSYMRDKIYNMNYSEISIKLLRLFQQTIDTNYEYPKHLYATETDYAYLRNRHYPYSYTRWQEVQLAYPLKIATSLVFDIPMEIVAPNTPEQRISRENYRTKKYNIAGSMTARQCLEYLGTNVFRDGFHPDFWINIAHETMRYNIGLCRNIVISDIRFDNELTLLHEFNGSLWVVYRNESDLVLDDKFRKMHPSKWNFLTFYRKMPHTLIHNSGSIEDLATTIEKTLLLRLID